MYAATEKCSSLLGMEATSTARDDPTMTLNLGHEANPRLKVIQMFGRALGLKDLEQIDDRHM